MSKSVGNVVDPFALADALASIRLRYFFMREVPFGQDGNYSHERSSIAPMPTSPTISATSRSARCR